MSYLDRLYEAQDPVEFKWFLQSISKDSVRSYLEIGSRHGGSLWMIGNSLPDGSKIISVDTKCRPELSECASELKKRHDVILITGDSTDYSVMRQVRQFAPFDLLFIDGGEGREYVTSDWCYYGPMARIVAFHGIADPNPDELANHPWRIDAPTLWKTVKRQYRSDEITDKVGIGIVWK